MECFFEYGEGLVFALDHVFLFYDNSSFSDEVDRVSRCIISEDLVLRLRELNVKPLDCLVDEVIALDLRAGDECFEHYISDDHLMEDVDPHFLL